jgi:hypothetical protein
MKTESISASGAIGQNDRWLYRVGGIAAYITGILYIIGLVLLVYAGKSPTNGAAWLSFVNGHRGLWLTVIADTLGIDIVSLVVNVTLYVALRPKHRGLALIATLWACAANLLIEATTNSNYGSLLSLSSHFATASTAQQAANVAAANYASAALSSGLTFVYDLALPSIAIVLFGIIMLRSPFGKRIAYLGIVTGVFGLISVSGWAPAILINGLLVGVWLIFVGRCLCFRYGAAQELVAPAEIMSETKIS